jgi:hypothetical protein
MKNQYCGFIQVVKFRKKTINSIRILNYLELCISLNYHPLDTIAIFKIKLK